VNWRTSSAPRVDEGVDELVDHPTHQLALPTDQHLLAERGAHQRPMTAVLGLVHAEDDVLAHGRAHDLGQHRRREGLAVEQYPGDVVMARDHEHRRGLALTSDLQHGGGVAQLGELGVRVAHVAGDGVVEVLERILEGDLPVAVHAWVLSFIS
jgi:hypothetical protein